jgi:hypothetical protein
MDRYQYVGLGLASFGVSFALYSYYILLNVPLAAFGLACIVLGGTLFVVPPSPLPAMQIRAMLEASLVNIEALLEEFNVLGKAVYLPPMNGRVSAVIPIKDTKLSGLDNFDYRVLTSVGDVECILIFPPGSEIVRLALLPEDIGLEDALSTVLVDFVELVDSVKAVFDLDQVIVELANFRVLSEFSRVNNSLGSLPVNIAGCVLARVLDKNVALIHEEYIDFGISAVFEVYS